MDVKNEECSRTKPCCSLCGESELHDVVDLSANAAMKHNLASYRQMQPENIEKTLKSICVQCVYKINTSNELARTMRKQRSYCVNNNGQLNGGNNTEACHNKKKEYDKGTLAETVEMPSETNGTVVAPASNLLTNQINKTAATETESNSPNNQKKKHDKAHEILNNNHHNVNNNLDISIITTKTYNIPNEQQLETNFVQLSSASEQTEHNLVEKDNVTPARDLPVDLLDSSAKKPTNIETSTPPNSMNSLKQSQKQESKESMLQIVSERSECALVTESGGEINNYNRVPNVPLQLICSYCARIYYRQFFYKKHIRRCQAKNRIAAEKLEAAYKTAMLETSEQSIITTATENSTNKLFKRKFHCRQCDAIFDNRRDLNIHKPKHYPFYRCEICENDFQGKRDYDFHTVVCEAKQMVLDTVVIGEKTRSFNGRLSRTRSNSRNTRSVYVESHDDDDDDDDDEDNNNNGDDVSVADTMYTKRMRFTGEWLEEHSNSNSYLPLCDNNVYDYDIDININSYKEYDLYLLDLLKAQTQVNVFTSPTCNFIAHSLLELMIHDYMEHFRHAWYYCRKCGRVFTSKVFLDYHLDRQNSGRYICFKCGNIYEFQHQLDHHLIHHKKFINYRCNYCNYEFLTEFELLQHCDREQHAPDSERKLICIDKNMTITNYVPFSNERFCARNYSSRTIEMHLPNVPSLRPMALPRHKPYRRLIGDVEFKDQKNPNCWGWQ